MKNIYYLYEHRDPKTNKIVYIGMGTGSRAWACGASSSTSRDIDHKVWIEERYKEGYTMGDITIVTTTLLTKKEAFKMEYSLIQKYKPIFNKLSNPDVFRCKKFSAEMAKVAYTLWQDGVPYYKLPIYFDLEGSNMSVLGKRMVEAYTKIKGLTNE